MILRELLRSLGDVTLLDALSPALFDAEATSITTDSRLVTTGSLFIAISGFKQDARTYAAQALNAGAILVVAEGPAPKNFPPEHWFQVDSARLAAARLAAAWYGYPSQTIDVYAVTGTNGKTTIATLLHNVLTRLGTPCGLISTVETDFGNGQHEPSQYTTPDPLSLHHTLARIRDNGCSAVCMEVSSQALHQHRTDAMAFTVAAFTNLTRDHLDYHGSMEAYYQAKLHLFELLSLNDYGLAAINLDDPTGERLVEWLRSRRIATVTYGFHPNADIRAENLHTSLQGMHLRVVTRQRGSTNLTTPLLGKHNASNLLAIFAMLANSGFTLRSIAHAIAAEPCVCGRLERIHTPSHPATWFVDYAHTPDALEHVLDTLRESVPGRLFVVFGCGGDRDHGKRPQMGAIAANKADVAILTSDNPRSENPNSILHDIAAGIPQNPHAQIHSVIDRSKAIHLAAQLATSPNDAVLVAGKGHEKGQIFASYTLPFDDHLVIQQATSPSSQTNPPTPTNV